MSAPIGAISAHTAAARAEFAVLSSAPDATRKNAIDRLIRRLQASRWWAGMDGCCIVDGTSPTPAFQNWRNPQVAMNIQNAPDLDPDAGSKGAGVVAEGPRTFWNPATASGRNMTASSMFLAVFCLNDSTIAGFDVGCATAFRLAASYSDGLMRANMGSGTGVTMAVTSSAGFRMAVREGTAVRLVADDVISAPQTVAVGALSSSNITIGFVSTAVSDRREFGAFWGAVPAGVTDAEIAEFKDAITEYFLTVNGVYEISCTISDPAGGTSIVPYRVFHDGTVLLDGTMIGTSLDIEAQITATATPGTPVVAWTDVDTAVSTGAWSGQLTGVTPGSNYKAQARLSDLSATSPRTSGQFGVGWNILFTGDSTMFRDSSIIDPAITRPVQVGDVRRFVGAAYNGTSRAGWNVNSALQNGEERGGPWGGDGTILMGNDLTAAFPTWSFGFIQLGHPGTTQSQWTSGGDPLAGLAINMWDAANYSITSSNIKAAPTWSQIGMVMISTGIGDSNLPGVSAAAWEATADQTLADLRTITGRATLPYCIATAAGSEGSPSSGGISLTDASVNAVRQGQLSFWDNNKTDNVFIICGYTVVKRFDQIGHAIPLHQRYVAKLRARTILHVLGAETYSACGPQITGVTVTGNTFVVTCAHQGGTALVGATGDTGLTGSELVIDGTVRNISTCEILSATTFGGTFDGDPAVSSALYRYLYGASLDGQLFAGNAVPTVIFTPNYVFDNDEVYVDAFPGIPLQPSRDTEGDGWMAASIT